MKKFLASSVLLASVSISGSAFADQVKVKVAECRQRNPSNPIKAELIQVSDFASGKPSFGYVLRLEGASLKDALSGFHPGLVSINDEVVVIGDLNLAANRAYLTSAPDRPSAYFTGENGVDLNVDFYMPGDGGFGRRLFKTIKITGCFSIPNYEYTFYTGSL